MPPSKESRTPESEALSLWRSLVICFDVEVHFLHDALLIVNSVFVLPLFFSFLFFSYDELPV